MTVLVVVGVVLVVFGAFLLLVFPDRPGGRIGWLGLEPVENTTSGGDPRTLQNWDVLRLRLVGALYDVRIGAEPDVELDYFVRVRE